MRVYVFLLLLVAVMIALLPARASGRAEFTPTTLVELRGAIGAFAQDGNRIAWLWSHPKSLYSWSYEDPPCTDFVQVLDLASGTRHSLLPARGVTCPPRDGHLSTLALAGKRALWAVYDVTGEGNSVTEYRAFVVTGALGERRETILKRWEHTDYSDEEYDGLYVWMAGDRETLVFDDRRVVGRRAVPVRGVRGLRALSNGRIAGAWISVPAPQCICNRNAAWAPDGSRIAFERDHSVYVIDAAGGNARKISVGHDPDWSPDGTKVVLTRGYENSSIHVVEVDGGAERRVSDGYLPEWSPDGTRLAFVRDVAANENAIYVASTDGSEMRAIARPRSLGAGPDWSPDGTKIAFAGSSEDGTIVVDVDTAAGRRVGPAPPVNWTGTSLAWSPNGRWIALAAGDIYVLASDGATQARITRGSFDEDPVWSPDGSRIAFTRYWRDPDSEIVGWPRVLVTDASGRNQRQLTSADLDASGARWAPDGSRIVYWRADYTPAPPRGSQHTRWELYGTRPDGTGTRRLTTTTPREGRSRVQIRDVTTGHLVAAAATVGEVRAVGTSSSTLALLVSGYFGSRIELFDARSGRALGGVPVPANTSPALSVADGRIVFRTGRNGRVIRLLDRRTMRQSVLATVRAVPIGLSIEGNRVAWAENLPRYRARIRAIALPT